MVLASDVVCLHICACECMCILTLCVYMRLCICECMCMYVCACNCVYMYMCMCVSAWDDALSPFLLEGLICQLRPLPVYIIERERERGGTRERERSAA